MSTSSRFILLIAVVLAACVFLVSAAPIINNDITESEADNSSSINIKKRDFSGDGTYYAPGLGSCGWDSSASDMIVALNHSQMGNGANSNKNPKCGKSITVTGPKGSVTVKIVDTCPGCSSGDVDLSPAAFNKIADEAQGRVPVTWSWN